jgi:hypothetical protein
MKDIAEMKDVINEIIAAKQSALTCAIEDWTPTLMTAGSQRHSLSLLTQCDPMDILDFGPQEGVGRLNETLALDDILMHEARAELVGAQDRRQAALTANAEEQNEALSQMLSSKTQLARELARIPSGRPEACVLYRELVDEESLKINVDLYSFPGRGMIKETRLSVQKQLAVVLANLGQFSESEALLTEVHAEYERRYGGEHHLTRDTTVALQNVMLQLKDEVVQSGRVSGDRIMASLYLAAETGSFATLRELRSELAASSKAPLGFAIPQSFTSYAAMVQL